jgi:hypothetical protein
MHHSLFLAQIARRFLKNKLYIKTIHLLIMNDSKEIKKIKIDNNNNNIIIIIIIMVNYFQT